MPFSNIIQQNMVVIRLSRAGAKKRPFYHICVSDRRNKRDGRFIERIGFYNPIAKDSEEKIRFDNERYEHWTSVGAKPSDTVLMLLKRSKMTDEEIQKLEDKKTARQEKKKQEKILKQQEEAAKEEAEAPAEEAPAEEAPAEEAPAEEAPVASYTVVNISATEDTTVTATSDAEEFRYEVSDAGVSEEGAYTVTIDGFDAANDKLTLVIVNGTANLTTSEFDQLSNVEVTSDGISGTQILFAPDSNAQSGKLVLPSVEESFDGDWTATTYTVEIIADSNLV